MDYFVVKFWYKNDEDKRVVIYGINEFTYVSDDRNVNQFRTTVFLVGDWNLP